PFQSWFRSFPSVLKDRKREDDGDTVSEVFSLSGGNPGAAMSIWEKYAAPDADGDNEDNYPEPDIELSYEDGFVLQTVLSKGSVEADHVRDVVDPSSLSLSLRNLERHGVVDVNGDVVSVEPARLKPTVDYLERRRLVW
ncbi:MAG: hypothetical protein SV760_02995, partial [Halobacteria archaeon]|nr:hypothetical protein [Halobacteria archaeon]